MQAMDTRIRHTFPVGTRIVDHMDGARGTVSVLTYDDDDEPLYGVTYDGDVWPGEAGWEYLYEHEFTVGTMAFDTEPTLAN